MPQNIEALSGERRRRESRAPSGVRYGKGVPPQMTRCLGERRELLQRGLGRIPCRKRILAYLDRHRTLLLAPWHFRALKLYN